MRVIDNMESQVRGYVRSFPVVFERSKGAKLFDREGKEYIDFFAGAGTLNYGHNNDVSKEAMIEYLQNDGVLHGLDMATSAKIAFLESFADNILAPRNMDYKIQFTGPTGTNAVESALKLARLIKGRSNVVAFTNAFHGMTAGSVSITGNTFYRDEAHISRSNVAFMPYDGFFGPDVNTIDYFRRYLEDPSSGLDQPAAVFVEAIQGEGGVNIASAKWLQELEALCHEYDMFLIVDDIQAGNGRSGDFFSFEEARISPDMVTVSKSIGGGLPMALLMIRPDLDQWKPGEHTGTFRGNNLAFVAARAMIDHYWTNNELSNAVKYKEKVLRAELEKIAEKHGKDFPMRVRGRGLFYGLEIDEPGFAGEVSSIAFERGLVIELSGAKDQVVKFLPPLIVDEETLKEGIQIIADAIDEIAAQKKERLKGSF